MKTYEFEKAKDMKLRVYALVQVGKYIGIPEMINQIKTEEKSDLKAYLKRYFLNTHGMPQEAEMLAWKYQQEGTEIGYAFLTELYNIQ